MIAPLMRRTELAACGGMSADVKAWRWRWLVRSGFPPGLAADVVSDPESDLHALMQLVDRGCAPELAVRILAPIPGQETIR
ncbi:hypothetical protein JMUB6875_58380 [Nocardia sp. JMUB6875]|uniref:hypothetical protein n=1 Tax=Nocardia sp. JMUB6875 TaxID=3158170 RepID=UPI0032E53BA6